MHRKFAIALKMADWVETEIDWCQNFPLVSVIANDGRSNNKEGPIWSKSQINMYSFWATGHQMSLRGFHNNSEEVSINPTFPIAECNKSLWFAIELEHQDTRCLFGFECNKSWIRPLIYVRERVGLKQEAVK